MTFFIRCRCLFVDAPVPGSGDKKRPVRVNDVLLREERKKKTLPLSITNTRCYGETYNIITL